MLSALVVLVTVLFALQVLTAVLLLRAVAAARSEVRALTKKLDQVNQRCDKQQAQLAKLQAAAERGEGDALVQTLDVLGDWGKKGTVPTLVALSARLFRSYSARRRVKPLPVRARVEAEK